MKRVLLCLLLVACSKNAKNEADRSSDVPSDSVETPAPAVEPDAEPDPVADPAETEPGEPAKAAPPAGELSNLQVLPKSWSKKQVTVQMKLMTKGLGVKCAHCHKAGDFANDDMPTKLAAREMIRMNRKLNTKYFAGKNKITCFTCHKGKQEPAL